MYSEQSGFDVKDFSTDTPYVFLMKTRIIVSNKVVHRMAHCGIWVLWLLAQPLDLIATEEILATGLQLLIVCLCVDYKNDTYSRGDACSTICCRGDLRPSPMLLGCYDAKVSKPSFLAWHNAVQAVEWFSDSP